MSPSRPGRPALDTRSAVPRASLSGLRTTYQATARSSIASSVRTLFATGRSIEQVPLGDGINCITCDHTDDPAVESVFREVEASAGRLDVLVNVAWGGYERMVEDG